MFLFKLSFRLPFALILLLLAGNAAHSQTDSLKKVIAAANNDSVRITALCDLAGIYTAINSDSAVYFAEEALKLAQKKRSPFLVAFSEMSLSYALNSSAEFARGDSCAASAFNYFDRVKNEYYASKALMYRSMLQMGMGNFNMALRFQLPAISYFEKHKKYNELMDIYAVNAMVYANTDQPDEALRVMARAEKLLDEKLDRVRDSVFYYKCLSRIHDGYGMFYFLRNDYPSSMKHYKQAIIGFENTGNKAGLLSTHNNLGVLYYYLGNTDSCLYHLTAGLSTAEAMGDNFAVCQTSINIGELYLAKRDFAKAYTYYMRGLDLAKKHNIANEEKSAYLQLSNYYKTLGNYQLAYDYHLKYSALKDSLFSAKTSKEIAELSTKYETDKKEAQIKELESGRQIQQLELDKREADIKRQSYLLLFTALGLVLLLTLAFFIYRGYKQKKKANIELQSAYDLIEEKSKAVEEKNKEMLDSIHYAKRIQRVLLASHSLLKKHLPEYFVLYKPKDIVSGDFYWAQNIKKNDGSSRFMLCVGDCTGHGVPGAFMSLLNISLLNDLAVDKKITHPNLLLNALRDEIIKALNPEGSEVESKDGMDAVLCSFDMEKAVLQFACANNPLWLIRNNELIEHAPDKFPVGMHYAEMKSFRLQSIQLQKDDSLYLFTDGYADQFGGKDGKKFKYKQLKELLLANAHLPMSEQQKLFEKRIEEWRGSLEQIDDILLVGIKV